MPNPSTEWATRLATAARLRNAADRAETKAAAYRAKAAELEAEAKALRDAA